MSPRLKTALALVVSFVLGGVLLWLSLRGVELARVGEALRDAAWGWILPLLVVTVVSHVLRAWRWKLLLDALPEAQGAPTPFKWALTSTFIGYLVNYVVPRGGEVARAANLASLTPLRFSGILGTVVIERVLDVLTLLLALLSTAVLFRERLAGVQAMLAEGGRALLDGLPIGALVAGLVGVALVFVLLVVGRRRRAGRRADDGRGGRLASALRSFREGLLSVLHSRQRGAILALSVGVWAFYLFMAYLPLHLLGLAGPYDLGLADAWGVMNVGAIGMAIPSPGGTGSYHYATVQAFRLLSDVPETPAATYALLTHAAQLVLFAVAGFVSVLAQGTSLSALRRSTAARAAGAAPVP